MTFNRRDTLRMLVGGAAVSATSHLTFPSLAHASTGYEPVAREDGSYTQSWFLDSFLELNDDLSEAHGAGKRFAVIWEQAGCPYCREMHKVNFAIPEITDWIKERHEIVQLDMWGAREVVDFAGETMEERALAGKWGIHFTPTILFFKEDPAAVEGKDLREAKVFRVPGYFKPFHFLSAFEYVHANAYEKQPFQRFLQDKFTKLEAEGKKADVW